MADVTLLIFSDIQEFGDAASTLRGQRNCDLVRSQLAAGSADDWAIYCGDCVDDWSQSAWVTSWDTMFNSGGLKARTHVVMGNHEYSYAWPAGWNYFGSPLAGPSSSAHWHSFDTANGWHIIILGEAGASTDPGIAAGSAQYNWLDADLTANKNKPTMVFVHYGRYSGCSSHSNNTDMSPAFARMLASVADSGPGAGKCNVEALISGHQHMYERFRRMNNAGAIDDTNGIRSWTMAGAGEAPSGYTNSSPTGLEYYAASTATGILKVVLKSTEFTWETLTPASESPIGDTSGSQTIRVPVIELESVLPDSDIATAGWTATPLYPKVSDSDDGTIVTGTLA